MNRNPTNENPFAAANSAAELTQMYHEKCGEVDASHYLGLIKMWDCCKQIDVLSYWSMKRATELGN